MGMSTGQCQGGSSITQEVLCTVRTNGHTHLALQPTSLWVQVWEHRWQGRGGCRCRAKTTMTMIERAGEKETPPTRPLCSGHHLGFLHGCVADHTLSCGSETALGTNEGRGGGLAKNSSSHY